MNFAIVFETKVRVRKNICGLTHQSGFRINCPHLFVRKPFLTLEPVRVRPDAHLFRGLEDLLVRAMHADPQPRVMGRKPLPTAVLTRSFREFLAEIRRIAGPAVTVVNFGRGEHFAAGDAWPMPFFHVAEALGRVCEVPVAEMAVELAMAVDVVVAKTVGVAEFGDGFTVTAAKMAR